MWWRRCRCLYLGNIPSARREIRSFPPCKWHGKRWKHGLHHIYWFDDIKFCTGLSTESKVEIKFKFLILTFVKEKQTRLEDSGSSREDMSPVEAIGQDDVRPRCQYLRAMACPPAAYRDDLRVQPKAESRDTVIAESETQSQSWSQSHSGWHWQSWEYYRTTSPHSAKNVDWVYLFSTVVRARRCPEVVPITDEFLGRK